ncbi:hypothetical protein BGZ70_009832 [Mortierella alpina]|uniref:NF-X1-type domain-containing protein n=1 Tax=Mortierella alpina TaxID=64518 RepID=A0A9P6JDA5_MORAP|nr:hypothetical protein BGZ70_009832 [Mortierella alpina]
MCSNSDYCQFVRAMKNKVISPKDVFMVESMGGNFESYRPILQALQTIDPGVMPFGKYFAPTAEEPSRASTTLVDPPRYALAPRFEFDLSIILKSGAPCRLNVRDPGSRRLAIAALRADSLCDDTQAQALVDSAKPPGTGKTTIGVELMRVLTHNAQRMQYGPILCICYSEHALDQFLERLLNRGINRMVRIGARSPKWLQDCNLYEMVRKRQKSPKERATVDRAHEDWHAAADSLHIIDKDLQSLQPSAECILRVVLTENEEHHREFKRGPCAASAGIKGKTAADNYRFWASMHDIRSIERENELRRNTTNGQAGLSSGPNDQLPLPNSRRPLLQLQSASLWTMSRWERNILVKSWVAKAGSVENLDNKIQTSHMELMAKMQECSKGVEEGYDAIRRKVLREVQVIGVTTYGAAKHQNLLADLKPKIVICEEAGEVLESHILAALSGSTEHLILIGDHLQLRPKICSYELSSESHQGRQYNLNRSLFERLVVSAKLPSSLLTTQRRMRPEICDVVRHALYPELVDGEDVFEYPDVPGMATNVFFMSHQYPEDARDQYLALSASNTFEAKMVKALVLHLLRNGCEPSSIAVLTPFIRQLTKLRDTLGGVTNLALYGRDQELLGERRNHDDISLTAESDQAGRITLRTVDNFQGEEADIVIISLVRSSYREDEDDFSSSIGFLKSSNRTNVLLSRAKHGMYLIGDAALMNKPQNGIWPQVITELDRKGRVGEGFLLRCRNHPDIEIPPATDPAMFETLMPDGICEMPCSHLLPCRHACSRPCHVDDMDHEDFECQRSCDRVHRLCGHACNKLCVENCGECQLPIGDLVLLCGHTLRNAFCPQWRYLSTVRCKERVQKRLPHCEHEVKVDCCESVNSIQCEAKCSVMMPCGHSCTRSCRECQSDSLRVSRYGYLPVSRMIDRTVHGICKQTCVKVLECGHVCNGLCHHGADCPPCSKRCAMACSHRKCDHLCQIMCPPCYEPCAWSCPHQENCPLPCGVPCSRLPCDRRCQETLSCGHQCPSLCGEECPPSKYCVECSSDPSTLSQARGSAYPVLVLPCGHALTTHILDHYMRMWEYYERAQDGTTIIFGKTKPLPNSQASVVRCPSCRVPIAGIRRYGRRIKSTQITLCLKKFEMGQTTALHKAEAIFSRNQGIREMVPLILDGISGLVFNSTQEVIQKSFLAMWQMVSGATSSSGSSARASQQEEDLNAKSGRVLGSPASDGDSFPNSDIGSLSLYDIPPEQEQIWMKLIAPALRALKAFSDVHWKAIATPNRRLFEASAAYLYDFRTQSYVDSTAVNDGRLMMENLARECGLPPDGHAGSSFVRSIQGRCDVLLLVLHTAMQVLEKISIKVYHDHPSVSGWSRFVEDLLQCNDVHSRMLRDAAAKGKYYRLEMHAKMSLLDIYVKRMQWLGHRPFDRRHILRKLNREAAVQDTLVQFKMTLQEIQVGDQIDLWRECLPKARLLEARMVTARKTALGELKYNPASGEGKLEIMRFKQIDLHMAGRCHRCPNGHLNMITNSQVALQQPICPDCDERVGDFLHQLH